MQTRCQTLKHLRIIKIILVSWEEKIAKICVSLSSLAFVAIGSLTTLSINFNSSFQQAIFQCSVVLLSLSTWECVILSSKSSRFFFEKRELTELFQTMARMYRNLHGKESRSMAVKTNQPLGKLISSFILLWKLYNAFSIRSVCLDHRKKMLP